MTMTMVEIYNETIRDLLSEARGDENIVLRSHKGRTTLTGASVENIDTLHQVETLLQRAAHARSIGETKANARSSRSHSVCQIAVKGTNSRTGKSTSGMLNLIDLAGSERLKQSEAQGAQLKETQAINKSLSALGDVVAALDKREKHIPYRNSKLTHLLQSHLGGDNKVLMFVHISSEAASLNESICSLRFASKVNSCEIGTAKRNATCGE